MFLNTYANIVNLDFVSVIHLWSGIHCLCVSFVFAYDFILTNWRYHSLHLFLYSLVVIGWILVTGTFILCGVFLLLHK